MNNRKRNYTILFGIIILFPLILNYLVFAWHLPGTNGTLDAWISFFGNYSGGIIGGFVAYIVSRSQIRNLQETQNLTNLLAQHPVFVRLKIDIEKINSSINQFYLAYNQIEQISSSEVNKEQIILGAQNLATLNEENWEKLELIQDVSLQVNLIQLKNDYIELNKVLSLNLADVSNEIERIKLKLDKLSKKTNKTPVETIEFNKYISEHLKLNTEFIVSKSKKEEYWENIKNGKLQENVDKIKSLIDEEITKIEKAKEKVKINDFI